MMSLFCTFLVSPFSLPFLLWQLFVRRCAAAPLSEEIVRSCCGTRSIAAAYNPLLMETEPRSPRLFLYVRRRAFSGFSRIPGRARTAPHYGSTLAHEMWVYMLPPKYYYYGLYDWEFEPLGETDRQIALLCCNVLIWTADWIKRHSPTLSCIFCFDELLFFVANIVVKCLLLYVILINVMVQQWNRLCNFNIIIIW